MRVHKITKEMFDNLKGDPSDPFYNNYGLSNFTIAAVRRCKSWNHWLAHNYKQRQYYRKHYKALKSVSAKKSEPKENLFDVLKETSLLNLLLAQQAISIEIERRGVKQ